MQASEVNLLRAQPEISNFILFDTRAEMGYKDAVEMERQWERQVETRQKTEAEKMRSSGRCSSFAFPYVAPKSNRVAPTSFVFVHFHT